MLPKISPAGTMVLVGIVIASVVLSEFLANTSSAIYVIPLATILCAATAWFFVRSGNKRLPDEANAGERREERTLTKGFLSLLCAIGWTGGVAVAVRNGIIPSDVNKILWSLVPAFALLVIGAVYLLRGFSGNVDKRVG